jgi:hypothetical protein
VSGGLDVRRRAPRWARELYRWVQIRRAEHGRRYLTWPQRVRAAWRHRGRDWKVITPAEAARRRSSDTIFILGSGPSIAHMSDEQWKHVGRHDSFGINFSFLLDFVPTFHVMEDGKEAWLRRLMAEVLAPRRRRLRDTVWFTSTKQRARGIHPWFAPELFPEHPTVCLYPSPPVIRLEEDRPFRAADFARTAVYRGTMSVVLHLVQQLGYRRIVLLGVDLHTVVHFFHDFPEMRGYAEEADRRLRERLGVRTVSAFPSMIAVGNKYRRFDEYLYALHELHLRPRGIELAMGNGSSLVCPRIPAFRWDD